MHSRTTRFLMATLSWSTTLPHIQCFVNPSSFNVFLVLLYRVTSPLQYNTQIRLPSVLCKFMEAVGNPHDLQSGKHRLWFLRPKVTWKTQDGLRDPAGNFLDPCRNLESNNIQAPKNILQLMAWIFFLRTLLLSNAADFQGLDFLPSIWRPLHHTILKGKEKDHPSWFGSSRGKPGKKTLEKHWKFRIRNTPCRSNFLAVHHWREQFSTQTKQNREITLGELNTPVMLQWLTVSHGPGFLPEASKQMRPGSWGIGHVLAQKQLEHVIRKIVMSLWDASVGLDDLPHQIEKAKYVGTRLCTLWVHCLDTTRYFWGISCFNRKLTDRFPISHDRHVFVHHYRRNREKISEFFQLQLCLDVLLRSCDAIFSSCMQHGHVLLCQGRDQFQRRPGHRRALLISWHCVRQSKLSMWWYVKQFYMYNIHILTPLLQYSISIYTYHIFIYYSRFMYDSAYTRLHLYYNIYTIHHKHIYIYIYAVYITTEAAGNDSYSRLGSI